MRVLYFVLCIISVGSVKKLPSYIEQCYRTQTSEVSNCIKRNINNLGAKLQDGIPELLIPPLKPLIIPSASLKPNDAFSCELKDIKLWNIENMDVSNLVMDLEGDKKSWVFNTKYDYLTVESIYHMKGKLLVLELDSEGTCIGNLTGIQLDMSGDLDTVLKNGKEHLHAHNTVLKMKADSGHFHFKNLFKNNEELNERANQILNENFHVFMEDFGPLIENIIKSFLEHIFNSLYNKYPFDVLFPKKV